MVFSVGYIEPNIQICIFYSHKSYFLYECFRIDYLSKPFVYEKIVKTYLIINREIICSDIFDLVKPLPLTPLTWSFFMGFTQNE